jgi:signal transduction histidine kinase
MQYTNTLNAFLYQHEILRAKLTIRDHYYKTIIRDIYENTGQILSLVQIQLALVEAQIKDDIKTDIAASRKLVGRAIYDLRDMGQHFFPEDEILEDSGLINALKRELKSYSPDNIMNKIKVKGIPFALSADDGLVFFLVILEIVTVIINKYGVESFEMVIIYSNAKLKISICYLGKPIDFNKKEDTVYPPSLTNKTNVHNKLSLIGGELIIKAYTNKRTRIDVCIPYNNCKVA